MKDLKFVLFKKMLKYLMFMCNENETGIKQVVKEERDYHINKALMWKHKAEYIIAINKALMWKHKAEYIIALIEEAESFLIRLDNNFKATCIEAVEFRIIKAKGIEIVDINGLFDLLNN